MTQEKGSQTTSPGGTVTHTTHTNGSQFSAAIIGCSVFLKSSKRRNQVYKKEKRKKNNFTTIVLVALYVLLV